MTTDYRHELIFHLGIVIAVSTILVLSFVMRAEGDHVFAPGIPLPLPPGCYSKMVFGVDCPGCGMTRAFISISHGQWSLAGQYNLASYALYAFLVLQIPWHSMQILLIWYRSKPILSPLTMLPLFLVMGWMLFCWLIF